MRYTIWCFHGDQLTLYDIPKGSALADVPWQEHNVRSPRSQCRLFSPTLCQLEFRYSFYGWRFWQKGLWPCHKCCRSELVRSFLKRSKIRHVNDLSFPRTRTIFSTVVSCFRLKICCEFSQSSFWMCWVSFRFLWSDLCLVSIEKKTLLKLPQYNKSPTSRLHKAVCHNVFVSFACAGLWPLLHDCM